ncbi:MAG: methyl-accepting chemotaxis protein [Leptospiraceae bacterium]|nr:methyl-accepting chemotaxis protein [Leptospiraceae bacterium]MCP5511170.1 methyl-accepting chemotaxis protein [Leptospiraceae bacterium]
MYTIELTNFGFRIILSGSLTPDELDRWISDSEARVKENTLQNFHVFLDLKEISNLDESLIKHIERFQRVFRSKGMIRSAIIVNSFQNKKILQKIFKKSQFAKFNRIIDSNKNPYWEEGALNWLIREIDPNRMINLKLREKLSLIVGLTIILVLGGLGFFIYSITLKNAKIMIDNELIGKVELVKDLINSSIDSSIKNHLRAIADKNRDLAQLYYTKAQKGELSDKEARKTFRDLVLATESDYSRIGTTGYLAAVNSKGTLVIHPKSEGVNVSGLDFMKKALEMKNGYLEYQWKNKDEKVEREKVGYLSFFEPWDLIIWASTYKEEFRDLIKVDDFHEIVRNIKIGETGYVYVIDGDGTFIIHRDETLVNKNYLNETDAKGFHFIKEIIKKKEGHINYYWKSSGDSEAKEKLVYFSHIPELDWYIVAGSYTDEFFSVIRFIRNIIIFSILASFFILFGILALTLSNILKPFMDVKQIVNSFAEGDLTRKIEIRSHDEIGEVSGYFNLIIDNFSILIQKLKDYTGTLLESTQNLSVTSKEISATSNTQAAAVREIVSTMEDSNILAKQISVSIGEVNRISNQTKESVETGVSFIHSSIDKMNEIKSKNKETISGIKALGEKIDSIWEIVNIINGIVDQTKIIAFNAALEASSAGEAGKNFQIVASEIKRLADNTMISTKEIKGRINEIQSSSNSLIIISEEGSERVKEGWEIANRLEEVFQEIQNSAEISAKSAGQIDMSIKQQVSSFEQILLTLKEISGGIENFVISTKNTSQASESLNRIAVDLRKIVDKYII